MQGENVLEENEEYYQELIEKINIDSHFRYGTGLQSPGCIDLLGFLNKHLSI